MFEIINSIYCWKWRQQTIIDAQKSCVLRGRGRFVSLCVDVAAVKVKAHDVFQ